MSGYSIRSDTIPTANIVLDPAETASRLHTARGFSNDLIVACRERLLPVLDCRFSAVRVPVCCPAPDRVDCGLGEIASHALYRNLNGCTEAFLFAVTTGIGVDRLLSRLSLLSGAEHFVTDALASAAAEAACERAQAILSEGLSCRPRFSPGYGDVPLTVQPRLLALTDAHRRLGISLNKSLLMSPMKSITAIMGINV